VLGIIAKTALPSATMAGGPAAKVLRQHHLSLADAAQVYLSRRHFDGV
jgi:hypothetical protein